jgi:sulfite exporter TauE/SafE
VRAAAALGAATPLLPCGPLYFLLSLALLSGSALRGAETLLAFGLGTVPLLWLAQANFHWVRARLGPRTLARLQGAFALAVAALLVWRLRGTLGLGGPGAADFICF